MPNPVRLKDLMRGLGTEQKLEILARADRLLAGYLPDGAGRYYGGVLTADEVTQLTAGLDRLR